MGKTYWKSCLLLGFLLLNEKDVSLNCCNDCTLVWEWYSATLFSLFTFTLWSLTACCSLTTEPSVEPSCEMERLTSGKLLCLTHT